MKKTEIVTNTLRRIREAFGPNDSNCITADLINEIVNFLQPKGEELTINIFQYSLRLLSLYRPDHTDDPLYLFLRHLLKLTRKRHPRESGDLVGAIHELPLLFVDSRFRGDDGRGKMYQFIVNRS